MKGKTLILVSEREKGEAPLKEGVTMEEVSRNVLNGREGKVYRRRKGRERDRERERERW